MPLVIPGDLSLFEVPCRFPGERCGVDVLDDLPRSVEVPGPNDDVFLVDDYYVILQDTSVTHGPCGASVYGIRVVHVADGYLGIPAGDITSCGLSACLHPLLAFRLIVEDGNGPEPRGGRRPVGA